MLFHLRVEVWTLALATTLAAASAAAARPVISGARKVSAAPRAPSRAAVKPPPVKAAPPPPPPRATEGLAPPRVARKDLKVTLGDVKASGPTWSIRGPKVRFVAPNHGDRARVAFKYLGPTAQTSKLASGAVRRQLGLKLRAKDGCNLIYVMWRISPTPELVVSTKANPGKSIHKQCGANGYKDVGPTFRGALPAIAVGSSHTLSASLAGGRLNVFADARLVWQGPVATPGFWGPAGLRTDNVAIDFTFSADRAVGIKASSVAPPTGLPLALAGDDD
jgi:hypothetical protein